MASDSLSPAGSAPKSGADLPDLLPARMLNEFAYCPRLFHLEWVQSEFRDSADTVEGRWQHRNVDNVRGDLPGGPDPGDATGDATGAAAGDAEGGGTDDAAGGATHGRPVEAPRADKSPDGDLPASPVVAMPASDRPLESGSVADFWTGASIRHPGSVGDAGTPRASASSGVASASGASDPTFSSDTASAHGGAGDPPSRDRHTAAGTIPSGIAVGGSSDGPGADSGAAGASSRADDGADLAHAAATGPASATTGDAIAPVRAADPARPSGVAPSPGRTALRRTSAATRAARTAKPADDAADAPPIERFHARSVSLSSERLGLIAVVDLVEAAGDRATPIDYKRGAVPEHGPWEPERVQVCAQALLLREAGWKCDEAILYYAASRERVRVPIDEALVTRTLALIAEARVTAVGPIPPPLDASPKCPRCSLAGICLPDETRAFAAPPPAEPARDVIVRRLYPARPVAYPVCVQEPGATVGRTGERLVIRTPAGQKTEVRLLDVSQLSLFGNVQVSAQALRDLVGRDIPIVHFSGGGWFQAVTTGPVHKNVELRIRQFAVAADAAPSLAIARRIVAAKVRNQRTILRRNHPAAPADVLHEMNRLAGDSLRAADAGRLLGLEGAAARAYFQRFGEMLSPPSAWPAFDFAGRNRRPPRDPVNAMLSFVYAMLVKDLVVTLTAVGFDPYLGFFHRPRYGRPALALDLAEEFRPLVGDSVVLGVVNTGEVRPGDFTLRAGAAALTPIGRRRVIAAYERRMDVLVRHPALGYSVSYRRLLELQARLLSRHLLGELPDYVPFRTR